VFLLGVWKLGAGPIFENERIHDIPTLHAPKSPPTHLARLVVEIKKAFPDEQATASRAGE